MYLNRTPPPIKYLMKLDQRQFNTAGRLWCHRVKDICSIMYLLHNCTGCTNALSNYFDVYISFHLVFMSSFQFKGTSSALSTIPVPKSLICRVPSSVEGISHELENVFIREDWEQGIQVGMCTHQQRVKQSLKKKKKNQSAF